ncbi:hypothetical protein K2173_023120 [Erythroxylum novogranatense]|uniref:Cytochrome P450 n=1 Tax=Erythroxylum novogranatense TaxID=1862640 RepID=A0AAV8T9P0_9ROSI|nr:hypothetical protein K2173_023120 [Erythroxylum novogranatense]
MLATLPYILSFLVIATTYWIYRWRNPPCRGKLPPGSMGLPLIGESIQFSIPSRSADMPRFVKTRMEKYGPIFKTSLAGRSVIISTDPEFNNFLFQQEEKCVEFWMMDAYSKLINHTGSSKDGGTSSLGGEYHRYYRRLFLDHLGSEAVREKLFADVVQTSIKTVNSWSTKDYVQLRSEISKMFFEFSAKYLFSYDPEKCKVKLWEKFSEVMQALVSFPVRIPGTPFYRAFKIHREIIDFLMNTIKERREVPEEMRKGDCIDQVLEHMKTDPRITDEFIAIVFFGFLLGGTESAASAFTFGMVMLQQNPVVLEQLQNESEEIIRKRENGQSELTWNEYRSMGYTMQVINEILRTAGPVAAILRRTIKEVNFKGYTIPEDWVILITANGTHLSPEHYEDPLVFNPSRWKDSLTNKNFMPFGGGIRKCPGAELTKAIFAVLLHLLVTKYSSDSMNLKTNHIPTAWISQVECQGGEIVRTSLLLGFGEGYRMTVSARS